FWGVVPAGGSGTRLLPVSRASQPKFLLPLLGDRSLLQQTADRLGDLTSPERTMVVCGPAHAAPVARQLPGLPEANVVVEPSPKGTCAAIALAAALIARQEPDAVMGSFAANHDVLDRPAFARAVRAAVDAAAGWLVTVGLTPTRTETGYGYIERTDDPVLHAPTGRVFRAARFVEKPDRARAEAFVASGRYLWNASMFVWRVRTFLDELDRLQPALAGGIARIADAWDTPRRDVIAAEVWSGLPSTSIDEGIMELSDRVAVVPAAMGWSDVGDWHGLGDLLTRDAAGNSVRADVVQTEATNNVVWSGTGRVIALVGLDNLVVVDAPDALLIADRAKAQEVRRIVGLLKDGDRADRV
ncbi:MAG: sugar phosphate nucleotidyltransferase, partial [Chloroflexota bacterium]|nr:sugar phosphate nucleotidyltransferase [Chloroflexota bacterium]